MAVTIDFTTTPAVGADITTIAEPVSAGPDGIHALTNTTGTASGMEVDGWRDVEPVFTSQSEDEAQLDTGVSALAGGIDIFLGFRGTLVVEGYQIEFDFDTAGALERVFVLKSGTIIADSLGSYWINSLGGIALPTFDLRAATGTLVATVENADYTRTVAPTGLQNGVLITIKIDGLTIISFNDQDDYFVSPTARLTGGNNGFRVANSISANPILLTGYATRAPGGADTTAPVLSAATATNPQSAGTVDLSVTTDEVGTGYWWVTGNASETAADIVANGTSKALSVGANAQQATGLAAGDYYAHWVEDDASLNRSNVVSTSQFTIPAGAGSTITSVIPSSPVSGQPFTVTISNGNNASGKTLTLAGQSLTLGAQDIDSIDGVWPALQDLGGGLDYGASLTLQMTDGADTPSVNVVTQPANAHIYQTIAGWSAGGADDIFDDDSGVVNGDDFLYTFISGAGVVNPDGTVSVSSFPAVLRYWVRDISVPEWIGPADENLGASTSASVTEIDTHQLSFSDQATLNVTGGTASIDANDSAQTQAVDTVIVTPIGGADTDPPSGHSVSLDQDPVNAGNETAVSFTMAGAEVGAAYSFSITSTGGGSAVTGNGTVGSSGQQITGLDCSGLGNGTLTLSLVLTDVALNTAPPVTDTATRSGATFINYPTLGMRATIRDSEDGTTTRIASGGVTRTVDLNQQNTYLLSLTHPLMTLAERDSLIAFYDANKRNLFRIDPPADPFTYLVRFDAEPERLPESGSYFNARVRLVGTRV